jgi:hypothetical protein
MFKLRPDNRERITQSHVERLKESISARNLLDMRPIVVNENMEVMDGQHRLMAAKELGCAIYYEVKKDMKSEDIILMNITKPWGINDFMNFFIKQGKQDYIELEKFINKNKITLRIALSLLQGDSDDSKHKFKIGKFKFNQDLKQDHIDYCWETIEYIKRMNGSSQFINTAKFWKALIKLIMNNINNK